eukprot:scaffold94569_cov64-Phaeocystis_antarctica.AAC.1
MELSLRHNYTCTQAGSAGRSRIGYAVQDKAGSAGRHLGHPIATAVAVERVAGGGNLVLAGTCNGTVGLLPDGHPHHVQRPDMLRGGGDGLS